jgi:hypothetical protein
MSVVYSKARELIFLQELRGHIGQFLGERKKIAQWGKKTLFYQADAQKSPVCC